MNRNTPNRFDNAPMEMWRSRSKFKMPAKRLFTGSNGDLIPFFWQEIVPGDTMKLDTSMVVRMTTPLFPTLDNLDLDYYYFFIPRRLVWDHWEQFLGDRSGLTGFEQPTEYEIPQIEPPTGGWAPKTIADYMGYPINTEGISIDSTLFRRYVKVWNDWFRREYLQDEAMLHTDDTTRTGSNGTGVGETYIQWAELGGPLLKVGKNRDYFVSALPRPQVGENRLVPRNIDAVAPVFAGRYTGFESGTGINAFIPKDIREYSTPAQLKMVSAEKTYGNDYQLGNLIFNETDVASPDKSTPAYNMYNITAGTGQRIAQLNRAAGVGARVYATDATNTTAASPAGTPVNLWADTAGLNIDVTVNDLRTAFRIQRLMERFARGGQRYNEIILANFSVSAGDARLQRSEYLGGQRQPIVISEVLQHSATAAGGTPLGETGAVSKTGFINRYDVNKSFVEHGWVIGVLCTRIHSHSYQNGVNRALLRKTKYDFFWPGLQFLSEQGIKNAEIFTDGTATDNEIFGYQERYAEYRFNQNYVMGEMRSDYTGSLDPWHYADDYSQLPTLSADWITEGRDEVDRTLAVNSSTADQFYFDVYLNIDMTRPMAQYGIPGSIDHF